MHTIEIPCTFNALAKEQTITFDSWKYHENWTMDAPNGGLFWAEYGTVDHCHYGFCQVHLFGKEKGRYVRMSSEWFPVEETNCVLYMLKTVVLPHNYGIVRYSNGSLPRSVIGCKIKKILQ